MIVFYCFEIEYALSQAAKYTVITYLESTGCHLLSACVSYQGSVLSWLPTWAAQ
jgi:hypothetical protein